MAIHTGLDVHAVRKRDPQDAVAARIGTLAGIGHVRVALELRPCLALELGQLPILTIGERVGTVEVQLHVRVAQQAAQVVDECRRQGNFARVASVVDRGFHATGGRNWRNHVLGVIRTHQLELLRGRDRLCLGIVDHARFEIAWQVEQQHGDHSQHDRNWGAQVPIQTEPLAHHPQDANQVTGMQNRPRVLRFR